MLFNSMIHEKPYHNLNIYLIDTGVARLFSVNVVKLWFFHEINRILCFIYKMFYKAIFLYSRKDKKEKDKSSWPLCCGL